MPAVRLPGGEAGLPRRNQNNPIPFAAEQVMGYLKFIFTVVGGKIERKRIVTETLEPRDLEKRIEI